MPRTDTLDKGLTGLKNRSPFPNHMVLNDGVTFEVRVSDIFCNFFLNVFSYKKSKLFKI